MSIILIIIIGILVMGLGITGYLEELFNRKIPRAICKISFILFIIFSGFSIYGQITSEVKMSELELRANTIQSIQLYVSIDATTPKQPLSDKETSAGLSSVVALFTKDGTRYQFVTDYQFTVQQVTENMSRLTLVYDPEDPTQLCGKPISFLKNMDVFACNYLSFFQSSGFDPGSAGNSIDMTIFINGIDIVVMHNNWAEPGVLAGGQAIMDVNRAFANISGTYSERLRNK